MRQQKYFTSNSFQINFYLPVFTIVAVSFIFYFSKAYHPKSNFNWQGVSAEVRDTVLVLEEQWAIYGYLVGYSAKTTPAWYRQNWFLKNATTIELQKLSTYPNPVVKTLAYEGLLRRNKQNAFPILKKILSDTTTVDYLSGCIGTTMAMNEYLVEYRFHLGLIATTLPPRPEINLGIDLTPEEVKELKSIYEKKKR